MSIYLGTTKLADKASQSAISVDSELSPNSTNPVENKAVSEALGYTWQKPSDWIDIRSGALPNSVYFLVGHSADYQTYPTFAVKAKLDNANSTYDVYVDGIKQASAVASDTATTLNWQTLALSSGWDVTYPSALRTHIVQVTPTTNTDTFNTVNTALGNSSAYGVLWIHATTKNHINFQFGSTTSGYHSANLRAVTCSSEALHVNSVNNTFGLAGELVSIPPLKTSANNTIIHYAFFHCTNLKRIKLIGFNQTNTSVYNYSSFENCTNLEQIELDDGFTRLTTFTECNKLKKLPSGNSFHNAYSTNIECAGLSSLEDCAVNVDSTVAQRVLFNGTSSAPVSGLKGLTVSSSAPFDGTSPQINVSYTGLDQAALVNLFNSMPTVTGSQVVDVTGATGAADLTAADLAIATGKGWTVTR